MKATRSALPFGITALCVAALTACGGGGGSSSDSPNTTPQSAVSMPLLISDGASDDWATIGVKLLQVTLTAQDGSTVTVFSSTAGVPLNLAQLDQLGEVLSNAQVPAGTYTGATLTLSANPGDISLVASASPETGFGLTAGASVPSGQIQVQGAKGAAGQKTVSVPVTFQTPLTVSAGGSSTALDLEVDLSHPAFLVEHIGHADHAPIWALNFHGPVRRLAVHDLRQLVLRHLYGDVTAVSSTAITVEKELPTLPVTSPETPVDTGQSLSIQVDATNGTLFDDLDAKTSSVIKSFDAVSAGLSGKQVRIAARYQPDGSLVATRIWASNSFNTVWVSPEGHVLHVDATGSQFIVCDETGKPVTIRVDDATQFYFRTPDNATADATPIGSGPAFLAANDLRRGFKVHVQVADPLAKPLVAQSVDIETAAFGGKIASPTTTGFTYTRDWGWLSDDYNVTLNYIASGSANGSDASGNAITGFKYWNFAYPTQVISGSNAVSQFVAATNGAVNFGGTAGAFPAFGASYAVWGDSANPTGWSAPWVVLQPAPLPRATVATGLDANNAFTITVPGGTNAATVDLSAASGSATLVYQIDRQGGAVTVTPQDITTSAGLAAVQQGLQAGAAVSVSAVPQADGTLKAYVMAYYTGDQPE